MNRFEYIAALKEAMRGMPFDVIAATVTEYEQRIIEASAAGKAEDEIIASLGDPQAIAAQRRASVQMQAFKQNKTPLNFFRLCFSLIGLMVFNLFLIVPAILYSVLLVCGYVASLACYGGGIIATAVAITGVNEISLDSGDADAQIQHVQIYLKDKPDNGKALAGMESKAAPNAAGITTAGTATSGSNTTSSTTANGSKSPTPAVASTKPSVTVSPNSVRIVDGNNNIRVTGDDDDEELNFDDDHHGLTVDAPGIHIYNPRDSDHVFLTTGGLDVSRPTQVMIGFGLILSGIIGFLLCLTISRYSIMGMFKLAQMEFAVLKNA